jgi:hypothetical protein
VCSSSSSSSSNNSSGSSSTDHNKNNIKNGNFINKIPDIALFNCVMFQDLKEVAYPSSHS